MTDATTVPLIDPDDLDPEGSLAPLFGFIRDASGGRLLNMHLQMGASAVVLDQYVSLRRAIGSHCTLPPLARSAAAVAASAADRGEYSLAINTMLARRAGWAEENISAIADGRSCGDSTIDALLEVVREAVRGDGRVDDASWGFALDAGWTATNLADTYGLIALVTFCDRFVRFARTGDDVTDAAVAR